MLDVLHPSHQRSRGELRPLPGGGEESPPRLQARPHRPLQPAVLLGRRRRRRLLYVERRRLQRGARARSLRWLSRLSSLRYLAMGRVDLSRAADWLHSLGSLPNLKVLNLEFAILPSSPPPPPLPAPTINLPSLSTLVIRGNSFGPGIPEWIYNISSLESIDLSFNNLEGGGVVVRSFSPAPAFGNLCSLKLLDMSNNRMNGELSRLLEHLSGCPIRSLETLNLSKNSLRGRLPSKLGQFKMLRALKVDDNLISGPIPPSIGGLSRLRELILSSNRVDGPVPSSLGRLSQLVSLDLRFNNLTGTLSEPYFSNLTALQDLLLSSNTLTLNFSSSDFVIPSQLRNLDLRSCKLGPNFPSWLRTQQNFSSIDISNAGISDTMPAWFWDNLPPRLDYLNISHNQIAGTLTGLPVFPGAQFVDLSHNLLHGSPPPLGSETTQIDLSLNSFSGSLASFLATAAENLDFIALRGNRLAGAIPSMVCDKLKNLALLDLSNNSLTGEIPACWGAAEGGELQILNLATNRLRGAIPESLGSQRSLTLLHLNDNNLHGEIPASLGRCTGLVVLDLGENNLTGRIPAWIGDQLSGLMLLRLRSNGFHGAIPEELTKLSSLQILDLAGNNLRGGIPRNFSNFNAMAAVEAADPDALSIPFEFSSEYISYGAGRFLPFIVDRTSVVLKGKEYDYDKTLYLVKNLDLSSNKLSERIPDELTKLVGLQGLNLSNNRLRGSIPKDIGNMRRLETLDLSGNRLSGAIPGSISSLTSLSYLNLSTNRLSGRIPSGSQIRTLLDPTIYDGNAGLCGAPLENKYCPGDEPGKGAAPEPEGGVGSSGEGRTDAGSSLLYLGMGIGYAVGLWTFLGSLLLRRSWRDTYFGFVDRTARKFGCLPTPPRGRRRRRR